MILSINQLLNDTEVVCVCNILHGHIKTRSLNSLQDKKKK